MRIDTNQCDIRYHYMWCKVSSYIMLVSDTIIYNVSTKYHKCDEGTIICEVNKDTK